MHKTVPVRAQRGITLVEALVTGAVIATVVGAAAPSFGRAVERHAIEGVATGLESDIQFARAEAVARGETLRMSFGSACYVVHGGSGDCTCAADGPAQCDSGATVLKTVQWPQHAGVSLRSNAPSMRFDPLRGTVSPTGTLRITGSDGRALHQVVNIMGRTRSCTPDAAMPGHRRC
jgi:type IV fimbrial biogenesis protein FimT